MYTHISANKTNPLNNTESILSVPVWLTSELSKDQKNSPREQGGITNNSSLPTVRCSVVLSNKTTWMGGREGGKKNYYYSFHSEKNPIVGGEGVGEDCCCCSMELCPKFGCHVLIPDITFPGAFRVLFLIDE
ncbi:hypothetical protein CDAR_179161 [Caerostris darwini]|uniref:Uncharacterized protein n=1 Tax=Caerostris darwini TaxID=1538125 RepID=A0AAV4PDB1_9ARAC|nr:hypothetical protein CDAR_179161 [Caerostris darwini]